MSIDAMKQALEALSLELPLGSHLELKSALRAAIEQAEKPRQWQGLTDDDIAQAMYRADAIITGPMQFKFAREIEAKLKEKNHE